MTRRNDDTRSSLTDCGIRGLRKIPYGTHLCFFYRDRDELGAAVVPYIVAGLRAQERCIWVTARPLESVAAVHELRSRGIDPEAERARGRLQLWDYDDWYLKYGDLDADTVCKLWLSEEQRALANGLAGLRVTGNVSFLTPTTWHAFMEYERAVEQAFRGRQIVALCTYPKDSCGISEMYDVMRHHHCALGNPEEGWHVVNR